MTGGWVRLLVLNLAGKQAADFGKQQLVSMGCEEGAGGGAAAGAGLWASGADSSTAALYEQGGLVEWACLCAAPPALPLSLQQLPGCRGQAVLKGSRPLLLSGSPRYLTASSRVPLPPPRPPSLQQLSGC